MAESDRLMPDFALSRKKEEFPDFVNLLVNLLQSGNSIPQICVASGYILSKMNLQVCSLLLSPWVTKQLSTKVTYVVYS